MKRLVAIALSLMVALIGLVSCGGEKEATPTPPPEPYVIGITADLTGAAGSTYGPWSEGYRIYFEALNASGGINGHPIELLVRDNKNDGTRAAADIRFFAERGVHSIGWSSGSSTLSAGLEELYKHEINTFYLNACYPPSPPPNAYRYFYCVGTSPFTDVAAQLDLMDSLIGLDGAVVGLVATDVPGVRSVKEKMMAPAIEEAGGSVILEVVPLAMSDLTGVAKKFVDGGATAVIAYTFGHHVLAAAEGLQRLGWDGIFMTTTLVPGSLQNLARLEYANIHGIDWYLPVERSSAIGDAILAAGKAHGAAYDSNSHRNGWAAGIAMHAGLEACGWPCGKEDLADILNNLTIDDAAWLEWYGSPLQWSTNNHTSPTKGYVIVQWNEEAGQILPVSDWFSYDEPGW